MPHHEPDDPPGRLADEQRGHGTFTNDRRPVVATIGRDSGRACCPHVVGASNRRTLEGPVQAAMAPGAMPNTDEWRAYGRMTEPGRGHATVSYGDGEWARDDDNGVSEVRCNAMEGTWTGLLNFLRPFRGVSKWRLGRVCGDLRVGERPEAGHR